LTSSTTHPLVQEISKKSGRGEKGKGAQQLKGRRNSLTGAQRPLGELHYHIYTVVPGGGEQDKIKKPRDQREGEKNRYREGLSIGSCGESLGQRRKAGKRKNLLQKSIESTPWRKSCQVRSRRRVRGRRRKSLRGVARRTDHPIRQKRGKKNAGSCYKGLLLLDRWKT